MSTPYIPARFQQAIAVHIIKNIMPIESFRVPLILGIHGPSGDGKTYQCEATLAEMNAKSFLISGGQLEDKKAGEPARLIRETYIEASRHIEKHSGIAVLLINDIDASIGGWGNLVQYTVNRQTVFGELMHLADYPTSVESETVKRVPIIVTGNDFTKLYEPLVRAGRMASFEWTPTREEKSDIILRIFPELSQAAVSQLLDQVDRKRQLPISFYSYLRSTLLDDLIWQEIDKIGMRNAADFAARGFRIKIEPLIKADGLINAAKSLIQSGSFVNHLRR